MKVSILDYFSNLNKSVMENLIFCVGQLLKIEIRETGYLKMSHIQYSPVTTKWQSAKTRKNHNLILQPLKYTIFQKISY